MQKKNKTSFVSEIGVAGEGNKESKEDEKENKKESKVE